MQGPTAVTRHLNATLGEALISVSQYFLRARMRKNRGMVRYADQAHGYSVQALRQSDRLIERILFLDHRPAMQDIGYLRIGETTEEMLSQELQQCQTRIQRLRQGMAGCEPNRDFVSRDLLEGMLSSIESEVDWHESRIALAISPGLENHRQSLVH